jgi:hypothetical protein
VCSALGNSVPEPLFEDFQEQVFEDPEVFFSGQLGIFDQFCTYFPIYSVECRNCMIGVSLHAPILELLEL